MFQFSVWVHEARENYPNPFHAHGEWECVAEVKLQRSAIAVAHDEMATNPRRNIQVWKQIAPANHFKIAGYDPTVAEKSGKPELKVYV